MPDFAARATTAELMDGDGVTSAQFSACLADLARVNTVTLARPPTLAWLASATRGLAPGSGFSLLDVGYGYGDMLRAVHAWAKRRGIPARLAGVDINPLSAPAARGATPAEVEIDFLTGDAFAYAAEMRPDFIISSLVAHHMSDAELRRFLILMETESRRGWFVNDLHRHAVAYYGFGALAQLARWHPFVRHDGPVSVARSFRRGDWERLLREAGIPADKVTIAWRFPFRLCVGRLK